MEANPDSLTPELIRDIYALGVNRPSIGVQSFDDGLLETLDRIHDSARAKPKRCSMRAGALKTYQSTLCAACLARRQKCSNPMCKPRSTGVTHVSVYPLTIEDHTRFAEDGRLGRD